MVFGSWASLWVWDPDLKFETLVFGGVRAFGVEGGLTGKGGPECT